MIDVRWFNWSAPRLGQIRPWNLFRRYSREGHWWGIGILQVGQRHLAFIGRTQGYPEREVWTWDLLFMGRAR